MWIFKNQTYHKILQTILLHPIHLTLYPKTRKESLQTSFFTMKYELLPSCHKYNTIQCQTLFFWAPKSLQMVTAAMKLKDAYSWKESYDQPR